MRRVLSVVAAASLVLVVLPAKPAAAIIPDKVGWWAKYQQIPENPAGVLVPPPPTIPSDQINVSGDGTPEGAVISAVRYVIPEGARAKLTLRAPEGEQFRLPPGVFINACITSSGWDGEINGTWATRPAYDCQRLATSGFQTGECDPTLSDNGVPFCNLMEFEFGPEFQESPGVIDVALAPGGTAAPFSVNFVSPDDSALELLDVPAESDPSTDFAPPDLGVVDPGFTDVPAEFGAADVTLPAAEGVPSLAPGNTGTVRPRPAVPFRRAAVAVPDSRGERILAFSLLVLFGLALWWIGGAPVRAPRLLGSLGARSGAAAAAPEPVHGIGRFRRPRRS